MYDKYFKEWEVKPEFTKEFVSLWPGWLGEENYHKLDEVTESEWARFNTLILLLSKKYQTHLVNCSTQVISPISDVSSTFSTFQESMAKGTSSFSKYVLPDLQCVISEEWDYTYIVWHLNNGAIEAISPFVKKAGLEHFHD